jgi:MoaA/NifB/PqqE/SkfB family radical SAM enzyme
MESEEITFAGMGEPLLRLNTLSNAAILIKDKRHGVPLRVKTNGLILAKDSSKVMAFYLSSFKVCKI